MMSLSPTHLTTIRKNALRISAKIISAFCSLELRERVGVRDKFKEIILDGLLSYFGPEKHISKAQHV